MFSTVFSQLLLMRGGNNADGRRRLDEYRARYPLSKDDLDQITHLLWMDGTADVLNPDSEWLSEQTARIRHLNKSLRSQGLMRRLTSCVVDGRRHAEIPAACLCPSHEELNPYIIRHIALLVAKELIERAGRFRWWSKEESLPEPLLAWLDRINAATALWLKRNDFVGAFHYEPPIQKGGNGCEACLLAAVGGRPQLLGDLRASLKNRRSTENGEKPRLWPFVEAWIDHYGTDRFKAFQDASDKLAEMIGDVRRNRPQKDCLGSQVYSLSQAQVHAKLPGACRPQHEQGSESHPPGGQDNDETLERLSGHPIDEIYSSEPVPGEDLETWDVIVKRIQKCKARQNMQGAVNSKFSDYGPMSAIPAPLARNAMSPRSSWVTMSVHTEDGDGRTAYAGKDMPLSRTPKSVPTEALFGLPVRSDQRYEDESEGGGYVPARQGWDKYPVTRGPCPRPPSSVYSASPGFRRSARDDLSTVFPGPRRM